MESAEYSVYLDGTETPVTIVAAFELPEYFGDEEQMLWVEAVLDDETLAQTAVRLLDRYSV
jgi:transcription termination factor NusB